MTGKREERAKDRRRRSHGRSRRLRGFIASMQQKHIAGVGRSLGMLAYILDRRHRRIVKRNLRFTHPEWPPERIRKVSKRVFQNMGITFLEICQLTVFSREDILGKVRIRGEKNLLDVMKGQRDIIMISAHLGNWEMAHLFFSCYFQIPLVLVARQIQSRSLDRWIRRLRTRFGNIVLDKKQALTKMARTLHQGRALGLLIDQGTKRSEGVEVTFFGRTTTATPAAALLARRYNSPVVPAFCIREADAGLTLVVERPLVLKRTQDLRADLKGNTQIMTSAIEKAVKAYPEQWFWFHKRWKWHHPYLYPEDLARRQRRRETRELNG
jgi:KDO2-lipid IV(A) lauroyltransferase